MSITLSLAMDAAGLIVVSMALLPMLFGPEGKGRLKPRERRLFTAAMLHLAALFMKLASAIVVAGGAPRAVNPYALGAITLDAASVITLILCGLSDVDGTVRILRRQQPLSLRLFAAAILPTLAALGLEQLIHGTTFLGISYSVSLSLVQFFLRQEELARLREREATLSARQARLWTRQIQPHFIFNTLASIEALCLLDPESAAACVEDLAGYLRGNIDGITSDEPIPFETELGHIRQYVALERADPARQFAMDYELGVTDFLIPALTVQPIVENAVKHGALSREDGGGRVLLRTEAMGSFIRITVEDNGLGDACLTEKQKESKGVGVAGTRERLEVQCGGSLTIRSGEEGTRAIILIPKGVRSLVHTDS